MSRFPAQWQTIALLTLPKLNLLESFLRRSNQLSKNMLSVAVLPLDRNSILRSVTFRADLLESVFKLYAGEPDTVLSLRVTSTLLNIHPMKQHRKYRPNGPRQQFLHNSLKEQKIPSRDLKQLKSNVWKLCWGVCQDALVDKELSEAARLMKTPRYIAVVSKEIKKNSMENSTVLECSQDKAEPFCSRIHDPSEG